jgi:hypothetical protein
MREKTSLMIAGNSDKTRTKYLQNRGPQDYRYNDLQDLQSAENEKDSTTKIKI